MKCPLNKISIEGFKSIKELKDFPLGKINVIVGANGAGKSNFIEFFRILLKIALEQFDSFIQEKGGADGFFFNGPSVTKIIKIHLAFINGEYRVELMPTVNNLMSKNEQIKWGAMNDWRNIKNIRREDLNVTLPKAVDWLCMIESFTKWIVYHFHDSSYTSPMRRDQSVRDFRKFNPDASNIAPFLLRMREKHPQRYNRIVSTIQLVAPFFDHFLLEPEKKGENEVVRLEWRQKGSSFPFQPWQLSDGTIRFICLVTALLQPEPPSLIIIDEPELVLHPFALSVLAGLMKEISEEAQLIVSTQSVTLLNHFSPEDIIVVDRENGESKFRRLDSDDLASWLEDYALGELWQKNVFDGGPSFE